MTYIIDKTVKDKYGEYGPYYVLRNGQGECIEIIGRGLQVTKSEIISRCSEYDDISESDVDKVKDDRRFGIASDRDFLRQAFNEAESIRDLDEDTGQNKADDMKVLEFEDGSEAYVVKTEDAISGLTPNDDKERFKRNNTICSKIIESLNGNACRCKTAENEDGDEYLIKEGIDGEKVSEVDEKRLEEVEDSINQTMSSAYFVGNTDLHAGNMIVGDDDELYIIDHDSSINSGGFKGMPDISHYDEFRMLDRVGDAPSMPNDLNIREDIYDKAVKIKKGDLGVPVDEGTDEYEYVQNAVDKAIRAAVLDDYYVVPEDVKPDYLSSALNGYESFDSFDEGMTVKYVSENGDINEGVLSTVFPNNYISIINESDGKRGKIHEDELNSIVKVE